MLKIPERVILYPWFFLSHAVFFFLVKWPALEKCTLQAVLAPGFAPVEADKGRSSVAYRGLSHDAGSQMCAPLPTCPEQHKGYLRSLIYLQVIYNVRGPILITVPDLLRPGP